MAINYLNNVLYQPKAYYKLMIKNRFSIVLGEKRMDKRDIVKITGLNRHTVANLFSNQTKGIDFATLDKLCFALDCTPNDLFRYIPDELADNPMFND